jgi:membrane protein insertase Oxa1/YidC/SpoIIIJ
LQRDRAVVGSSSVAAAAAVGASAAAPENISALPSDRLEGAVEVLRGLSDAASGTASDSAAEALLNAAALASNASPGGARGVELPLDSIAALLAEPPSLASHTLDVLRQLYPLEEAQVVAEHLSHWWTVQYVEAGLHWLHDAAHLPWWATIVGATLALRMALAPVNVLLLRNTLRMKLLAPQVAALEARMADPAAPAAAQVAAAEELTALFRAKGCSPWKNMLVFPVLLPPTILSIFGAIYNVSMSTPAMAVEGLAWFPDLLLNDGTYLLPVLSAATWLLNVESGAGVYYHSSHQAKFLVRTAACMAWALSAPMPSGALLFWVTSNLFAVARGYVTRFDGVRRALGIPLASEIAALTHLPKSVT